MSPSTIRANWAANAIRGHLASPEMVAYRADHPDATAADLISDCDWNLQIDGLPWPQDEYEDWTAERDERKHALLVAAEDAITAETVAPAADAE